MEPLKLLMYVFGYNPFKNQSVKNNPDSYSPTHINYKRLLFLRHSKQQKAGNETYLLHFIVSFIDLFDQYHLNHRNYNV